MHIFTTLGRADPELFRRWLGFGGALLGGTLPGRLRELVILRTAARFGGRYEWAQHIELAEAAGRDARRGGGGRATAVALGSTRSSGRRSNGRPCAPWTRRRTKGRSSDATWDVLAATCDESELIELLMLIGHYLMLTTVLRSLRIPLEPRAEALAEQVPGGPADVSRERMRVLT